MQFDDGREIDLLHFVYNRPNLAELRGSPAKVLQAIDDYGRTAKFLMNVGQDKGKIVTDLIAEVKPQVMVELGGYVGFSAVLFGNAMRAAGGKRYWSLERNPAFAAVVMCMVELAGLSDIVKVVVGASSDSLKRLHEEKSLQHIDLLFLDHYKPAYLSDLKLAEHLGLVSTGSVLAADNVIKPGNPPYLEYVRRSVEEKKERFAKGKEEEGIDERFPERIKEQYRARQGEERLSTEIRGNPNLVYQSEIIHSYEPTGVPVSRSRRRFDKGSPPFIVGVTNVDAPGWSGDNALRWRREVKSTS